MAGYDILLSQRTLLLTHGLYMSGKFFIISQFKDRFIQLILRQMTLSCQL